MQLKTTQLLSCCILLCILFILPTFLNAQPVFDDDVNDILIDGGLSLLAAAGVGYGAKKLNQRRNKRLIK